MGIFNFKKKKEGRASNIKELRSPYLKKLPTPAKFIKRSKKPNFIIPPARFKAPSSKNKYILAGILSLGITIFSIYAIFFSNYFLITKYQVEEKETIIENNQAINDILQKQLGKNLALIDQDQLIKELKTVQPEIKNLAIKKIFPGTLKVVMEKFPTVANITNIAGGVQKKFLSDSQGLLTEENAENPDLPYIKIETRELLPVHTTFLSDPKRSAERLTYMIQAINLFEEKFGMKILFAKYLVTEREVHLYTEKYFYVMIDIEKDLVGQLEKLKKAGSKLDIYREALEYIDLRISGTETEKIIFKRKK